MELFKSKSKLGFSIKFSHIIDSRSNSFAINNITGETYLNEEIGDLSKIPITIEKEIRILGLNNFNSSPIREITIP